MSKPSLWYNLIFLGLEFFGRYYSSYRGFVVDNNDPEKLNRVRVILPSIQPGDSKGIWAYPKGNWGSKDYGVQLLPQKGDMVWVEFEQGDLDNPVWSFAGFGTDELPNEFSTPNHYGFKTPRGTLILINDNKDEESIKVKRSGNNEWLDISKDLLELESKIIKIGKDATEWSLKGETTMGKIDLLIEVVRKLNNNLGSHTHQTLAPYSTTMNPIQAPEYTSVSADIEFIDNTLNEILSTKVKSE